VAYGLYLPAADKRFYHEKGWGFDPKVLEINDGVYLDGFFQSEKYFKDIEPNIRKDLLLKNLLPTKKHLSTRKIF
jgi:hypothetical protein